MKRHAVWLVVVIALVAGCSGAGQPANEPGTNATLSLPGYEQTASASSVQQRVFYDRSKSWENPGNRSVMAIGQTYAYSNSNGTDTAFVHTTLNKPYIGADRVRSLSAPELADLATRSVGTRPLGNTTGPSYRASLLEEGVTVRTVTGAVNRSSAHVAHRARDDAIVVVVVVGDVDRSTVERVLAGVTLGDGPTRSG